MSPRPPETRLMQLANAFQLSRAVQVAARLGLGALLGERPRTAAGLARSTATDEKALGKLLRFLAEIGVVEERADGRFGPTELSRRLHLVDNIAQGEESWAVWGALPEALRTGRSVFADVHGVPFYEYAAAHPEQEARWTAWNSHVGSAMAPPVAAALELEGSETVVDVGGGEGALLVEILRLHPGCRGILFDLQGVVREAAAVLAEAGVGDRCQVVAGDGFRHLPAGGDVYLLSRVLMNWPDEDAVRLLTNCRRAMDGEGLVKVVETLMPEVGDPRRGALAGSDLNLLLLWGGGHRTRMEMDALCTRAGLALTRVRGLAGSAAATGWQVIEAAPSEPLSGNRRPENV